MVLHHTKDEHKFYGKLVQQNNIYDIQCHKYYFVAPITGVHTQNAESMINCIKSQIKKVNGLQHPIERNF